MGRIVDFDLGYASNLDSRRLQIFRLDAGGATMTSVYDQTLAANTRIVSTELAENLMYQAKLTDTRGGNAGKPSVINFSTGDAMAATGFQSGPLKILHWEDTSSSSSSSSSSTSSLSSTSTLSSSSSTLSSSSSSLSSSSTSSLSSSSST